MFLFLFFCLNTLYPGRLTLEGAAAEASVVFFFLAIKDHYKDHLVTVGPDQSQNWFLLLLLPQLKGSPLPIPVYQLQEKVIKLEMKRSFHLGLTFQIGSVVILDHMKYNGHWSRSNPIVLFQVDIIVWEGAGKAE